jgi:hypothetical protein
MGIVTNSSEFSKGLEQEVEKLKIKFRNRIRRLMNEGMVRMLRRTPVNTGQAIMNYVASVGTPFDGVKEAGDPVEATNHLALGAERLRNEYASVSLATLNGVDYNDPYQVYWIANNAPDIGGLEYGLLPQAPYTPRSPSGMFGVTVQDLISLLDSGSI